MFTTASSLLGRSAAARLAATTASPALTLRMTVLRALSSSTPLAQDAAAESSESRPAQQYSSDRAPRRDGGQFRPRSNGYNNNNNTGDSENVNNERRGPPQDRTPLPRDAVQRFRILVDQANPVHAWRTYENIIALSRTAELEMMDHIRLMALFRNSSLTKDYMRIKVIFMNLEELGGEIPVPVYETLMHRAFRSDPADVEMYYKKLVAAHGESSVTTTVVAARMNAARKTNDWVRVHELAAEAEQQGIDTLPLQTIVMDAFWAQGDEASAMRQFHAFVDAPSQRPLDIARAYSWLANLYLRGGRLTEAEATINALEARGVRTNPAAEAIRARVAMARGDLQAATAGVRETIRASRRETFTAVVTELVHAYVAAKDLEGLHKFYKYYAGEYERIHDLRFGPFVIGIQAYTTPENIAQYLPYAEEVFEMIPIQGKYKNSAILKAVVDGYLQAGKVEQAKALVNTASKKGFRVAVPSIEYIDNHSKRMADRAARESANAATSAAHFAATKVAIVAETKVADDAAPAVEAKAADAPIVEKAAAAAAPDVEKPAAAAAEAPKAEVKIEETNAETPKAEVPKTEATKTEAPAAAAPEVDAPKVTAGAPKAAAAQK